MICCKCCVDRLSRQGLSDKWVPVNVRALPDARSRPAVNGEAEFRARSVKPFGLSRCRGGQQT